MGRVNCSRAQILCSLYCPVLKLCICALIHLLCRSISVLDLINNVIHSNKRCLSLGDGVDYLEVAQDDLIILVVGLESLVQMVSNWGGNLIVFGKGLDEKLDRSLKAIRHAPLSDARFPRLVAVNGQGGLESRHTN